MVLEKVMSADCGKMADRETQLDLLLFDNLYQKYKSSVYGFACYLTRDRGEAEDALSGMSKTCGVEFRFLSSLWSAAASRLSWMQATRGKKLEDLPPLRHEARRTKKHLVN